jgi:hypothetical protein
MPVFLCGCKICSVTLRKEHRLKVKVKIILRSVSQSDLVAGTHLGPQPCFLLSVSIFRQGFVDVERPLWWEVGSVIFIFCWALPAQPFSGLNPKGLMSMFYCLYVWNSANWCARFLCLLPRRNTAAQLYPRATEKDRLFTGLCPS